MAALLAIGFSFVLSDQRTMQLLLTSLCLVAALLVAAVVVALLNRWRRQHELKEEDLSPTAQLAHFRSLFEAGTIGPEEFERVRAVLSARMRESLGVSATPKPAAGLTGEASAPPKPPQTGIKRPDGLPHPPLPPGGGGEGGGIRPA